MAARRTDGNPIYGLSCPTTTVCYATDIYAHVVKTTDGGATWTWQTTPITTPGLAGRRAPAGRTRSPGLMAISCSDASTCVASGLYVVVDRPDDPEHRSADRHDDRRRHDVDAADEQRRHRQLPARRSRACRARRRATAVGRGGKIVTTTDLVTWTPQTSNTTNMLNSVTCLEHVVLHRGRPERHRRHLQRHDVDGDDRQRRHRDARRRRLRRRTSSATPTGKQGVTLADDDRRHELDAAGRRRHDAADERHLLPERRARATRPATAGTILKTTNGGQTWLAADERHDEQPERRLAAASATACVAVGAVASGAAPSATRPTARPGTAARRHRHAGAERRRVPARRRRVSRSARPARSSASTDGGATWTPQTSGTTNALNAVACPSADACYAVGAAGTVAAVRSRRSTAARRGRRRRATRRSALSGIACVNALVLLRRRRDRHRRSRRATAARRGRSRATR